ncbi:MAG: hypothetical protein C0595_05940 [Marinilabiliales bacterium]|nr:MAG: hypothetical protein C0595_05940 [Marinilabiliales bacterium]
MKISLQIKRKILLLSILVFSFTTAFSQFDDLKFGTDSTLDVVTWNIEHFPKNGETTINFVAELMIAIDADVFAIQEVVAEQDLQQLVELMPDWDYAYAYNQYAALSFVYNTDSISDVDFFEIYTNKSREFPRSPFVMEFTFRAQQFMVINNHLKCCGDQELDMNDDWDEEKRRFDACVLLDSYIESNYPDSKVIITGDLNDVLSDDFDDNVFEIFIANDNDYLATDLDIAYGDESDWSYPSWPSHLDHLIISNELIDEYMSPGSITQTIKPDEYFEGGFSEYDNNVTDHRPVGIRIKTENHVGVPETVTEQKINIYPNPVENKTTIWFYGALVFSKLEIFDAHGKIKLQQFVGKNTDKIDLNLGDFDGGVYFVKLTSDEGNIVVSKIIVK